MDDSLKQDIMRDLGLDLLPPEEREAAFGQIGALIFQKVMLRIADILSDEDQAEMERMMEANKDDGAAIFTFLQAKVPGFEQIVSEEASNFRSDAMGVMDQVK